MPAIDDQSIVLGTTGRDIVSDLAESIAIHGHGATMPTAQCQ